LYGFNDNSVVRGELTPSQDAAQLAQAGANSARISIEWDWVQSAPGTLDLGMYDGLYAALQARGIRPMIIVSGAPRWAWPASAVCADDSCHYPPDRAYDSNWYWLVRNIAQRYPNAAAIEVWNEPNLGLFFADAPDPVRYTELLKLAYQAVKSVRPEMPVLGGALAPALGEETTADHWGMRPFLRGMYAAGARGYMDGISLHPYPGITSEGVAYEAVDQVLAVRDEHSDRSPLWFSEIGVSSTEFGFTEASQAALLSDFVPRMLRRPEVKGVYVHTLLDPQSIERTNREAGYGVMRSPGVPKPAYCSVTTAFGAGQGCTRVLPPATRTVQYDAQEQIQAGVERALAYRRTIGSYVGMTATSLGTTAALLDVGVTPLGTGARLCKTTSVKAFCVAIRPGADFRFRSGLTLDDAIRALADQYGPGW
jgi:hypothetical protein